MSILKKFRYVLLVAVFVFAFVHACNMFGCNPARLHIYECPGTYHMEGVLTEAAPAALTIINGEALSKYQWKVFEKYGKEKVYFISFQKAQKIEGLYYRSFFAAFERIPEGISLGREVKIDFQFICLDNFFYSAGFDVTKKRIAIHYAPVIFVNTMDIK